MIAPHDRIGIHLCENELKIKLSPHKIGEKILVEGQAMKLMLGIC